MSSERCDHKASYMARLPDGTYWCSRCGGLRLGGHGKFVSPGQAASMKQVLERVVVRMERIENSVLGKAVIALRRDLDRLAAQTTEE